MPDSSSSLDPTFLVQAELMQLKGTLIDLVPNYDIYFEAAVRCLVQLKLTLGDDFCGSLVLQDTPDLREFYRRKEKKRFESLGGFKLANLKRRHPRSFSSIRSKYSEYVSLINVYGSVYRLFVDLCLSRNTVFLLTIPYLKAICREAPQYRWLGVSAIDGADGARAIMRPMPVMLVIRNPSEMEWGDSARTKLSGRTNPCCASFRCFAEVMTFIDVGNLATKRGKKRAK